MNIDNIVIPGGILATWDGPQSAQTEQNGEDNESFDIVEVARERARSLSTSIDARDGGRGSTLERMASTISPCEMTQAAFGQESHKPRAQRPGFHRQRSNSIDLGGLARSRATGLSTPANPGLRLEPIVTFEKTLDSTTMIDLEDLYVFQRLEHYKSSNQNPAWSSSAGPLHLARGSSVNTASPRKKSPHGRFDRTLSGRSRHSSANVARRTSIAVGNVVEKVKDTVTGPLHRSSIEEVYEKAKIRQVQLMRSTVAQISFQYVSYLLMLAAVYFIFVGYPLWEGLVLVIYNVFRKRLAIPVGTAVFLGIAFL